MGKQVTLASIEKAIEKWRGKGDKATICMVYVNDVIAYFQNDGHSKVKTCF